VGEPKYVSRANADDSLEVWVAGWRVHFAPDEEPVVEKDDAPAGVGGVAGAGEKVESLEAGVGVSWRGRIVLLRGSEKAILPEKLKAGGSWGLGRRLYRRHVD
jgi:hypothetical protein